MTLELELVPGRFAACRLAPTAQVPAWVPDAGSLAVVARTAHELSILCDEFVVPADVRAERGFCAIALRGPLPFDAIGILAAISTALAGAGIPLLAISTFDTDYVLVRAERLEDTAQALREAGHAVQW
jgi:uncharacterized protein